MPTDIPEKELETLIMRQLQYRREETKWALDFCAFISGLPVLTFELKNSLTQQTVEDAIEQSQRDRDRSTAIRGFAAGFVD